MSIEHAAEEKKNKIRRQEPAPERTEAKAKDHPHPENSEAAANVSLLQRVVGNRVVQRLLAQRSAKAPFTLDSETEARINSQRGGGQSLDDEVRARLESSMGVDFSQVRVHTSPEADTLNRQLGAKAFTTGNDIFFRQGQYDPHSSAGQELIAHEATHVVQQNSGMVQGGTGMTVNAPGDAFEQEADAVASQVMRATAPASLQRDPLPAEEEEELQMQEEEEEEELQMQEEEEEELQMQEEEEEELQMQPMPEEEELQMREEQG